MDTGNLSTLEYDVTMRFQRCAKKFKNGCFMVLWSIPPTVTEQHCAKKSHGEPVSHQHPKKQSLGHPGESRN